jgi:hypothetical protein
MMASAGTQPAGGFNTIQDIIGFHRIDLEFWRSSSDAFT